MSIEAIISTQQHRRNFSKMGKDQLYAIYYNKQGGSNCYKPKTKRKLIELIMFWYQ
jgi:hypothetical protein